MGGKRDVNGVGALYCVRVLSVGTPDTFLLPGSQFRLVMLQLVLTNSLFTSILIPGLVTELSVTIILQKLQQFYFFFTIFQATSSATSK